MRDGSTGPATHHRTAIMKTYAMILRRVLRSLLAVRPALPTGPRTQLASSSVASP